jgi:hypothetical protein
VDHATLESLRQRHPAWRLLRSDHAALVAAFLHRAFVGPNVRTMAAANLAEALEDELYALRQTLGPQAFPKPATAYLDDWAAPERGWLRKFYRHGSDKPQFDLTPATEKAISWLGSLTERAFVGTESRPRVLFDPLWQMSEGTEADPWRRLAELHSGATNLSENPPPWPPTRRSISEPRSVSRLGSCVQPVLQPQSGVPFKVSTVVGHQDHAQADGVSGDQFVEVVLA